MSPNTLRAWERRFGFPKPQRSPGRHRLFTHGEIAALRDALQDGLSISSAVSRAREGLAADAHSLVGALSSYEADRADLAMEATLALRSLERSVSEIVLPSLAEIHRRHGPESAAWAFAAHWAADWLRRAIRLAPVPVRPLRVMIGDATRDELDPDSAAVRALELFCRRAGADVLTLSARGSIGIADAVTVHRPDAVLLCGEHLGDDAVARWAYAVRLAAGTVPMATFRRGARRTQSGPAAAGARALAPDPALAAPRLLELAEAASPADAAPLRRAG